MFFLLVVLFIAFFIRVYPRLIAKDIGVDSFYYLKYSDALRLKRVLPARINSYLLDIDEEWYPPLTSLIVSFIPRNFFHRFYWLFNTIIDCILLLSIYSVSFFISNDGQVALIVSIFYALSPISVTQSCNLNSRVLGALFLFFIMVSYFGFYLTSDYSYIGISIALTAILLLTHKLAVQQLVIYALGISVLFKEPVYIISFAAGMLTAIVISKGFYLKILKGHVEVINFWRKNLKNLYAHQVYASKFYENAEKAKSRMGVSGVRGSKFSKTIALIFYSSLFTLSAAFFVLLLKHNLLGKKETFISVWMFLGYFTVFSTGFLPVLKWIGEGFKYLLYLSFPVYYLVSLFIINFLKLNLLAVSIMGVLLILSAILVYFINSRQLKNSNALVEKELNDIFRAIDSSKKDNILCLPVTKAEAVAFFTEKKVLWGGHGSNWENFGEFFPILKKPIEHFVKRYNINLILIDSRYVLLEDLKLGIKYNIALQSGPYELLEVI